MKETFEKMLSGGHPNSLGRTIEVVDHILKDKSKLEELYQCYFSEDEVVRLRVSNAFKRVTKEKPEWVAQYIDKFITTISKIDQASTKWTIAQLFLLLDSYLSDKQRKEAIKILKKNLEASSDWIVLNMTMETLTMWSKENNPLRGWLLPQLHTLQKDERKSVAKRAKKFTEMLEKE